MIMDRSGSVGSANFQKARDFVTDLVHKLQISSHGTRVGIIAYQNSASLIVNFANHAAQDPNAMAAKIKAIHYSGGGTRTDIALQKANSELFTAAAGDRADKPNVLVVMTDGKTNSGSKPYREVLDPLLVSKHQVPVIWTNCTGQRYRDLIFRLSHKRPVCILGFHVTSRYYKIPLADVTF